MTYNDIADIAASASLSRRITAAATQEGKAKPFEQWAWDYRWELASSPGWADAWASAVASGITDPGADEGVITDGMILSAVQPMGEPIPEPIPEPEPLTLTALEPNTASITDADFDGHLRGTGFTEDTVIIWNGAPEPTTFVDSTDIFTLVKPSVVTAPTVLDVYVVDGAQASGILPFTWTA